MYTQPRYQHAGIAGMDDDTAGHASSPALRPPRHAEAQDLPHSPSDAWQQFAWDKLPLDELIAVQRALRPVIEAKRKRAGELRQQGADPVSGRALPAHLLGNGLYYKAKVASLGPASLRGSLRQIDRCVLGVSLGGSNAAMFQGAKLEASVRWIAARARRCRVLIGDSMGRISLQVRHGMDPETAQRVAHELGRCYARKAEKMVSHYSGADVAFELCYSSEYASHPCFGAYHDHVRALYRTDVPLRRLVDAFADDYLTRTARRVATVRRWSDHWRTLGREYLLEEMALVACLVADGWPMMVYPGAIDSFVAIAEGRHPALPAPLQALQFVALHLKKRGQPSGDADLNE
jgi:tRNA-dependent cyclodipeptide synthase